MRTDKKEARMGKKPAEECAGDIREECREAFAEMRNLLRKNATKGDIEALRALVIESTEAVRQDIADLKHNMEHIAKQMLGPEEHRGLKGIKYSDPIKEKLAAKAR